MCARVCECMRACVFVRVHACVCICASVCVSVRVRVRVCEVQTRLTHVEAHWGCCHKRLNHKSNLSVRPGLCRYIKLSANQIIPVGATFKP